MNKKLIIIGVAAVALLGGGGFFAFKSGLFGAEAATTEESHAPQPQTQAAPAAPAPPPVAPVIQTAEVPVNGILVSINRESRQSLLLLDIALIVHENYEDSVMQRRSTVVNSVLKALRHKDEAYFYSDDFIDQVQVELQKELSASLNITIENVLVTKAVYQ